MSPVGAIFMPFPPKRGEIYYIPAPPPIVKRVTFRFPYYCSADHEQDCWQRYPVDTSSLHPIRSGIFPFPFFSLFWFLCSRWSSSCRCSSRPRIMYVHYTINSRYFVLSTWPLHTNSSGCCGKERRILIGLWWPARAALVRNYLEVYWPCAGGLSAVNAIGTQLRGDPINSGLTRMAYGGLK